MISSFACLDLPFSSTKEGFPRRLLTMYGPCLPTVSGAVINSTFVHKNELISLVCTNTSCKIHSFLGTALNCSMRKLFCMLGPWDQELILCTFFMLYPPLTSVLHIVGVDTDTLYFSSSSNHNSSKYKSGVLLRVLKRCCITKFSGVQFDKE
jgi:hypothetical protein